MRAASRIGRGTAVGGGVQSIGVVDQREKVAVLGRGAIVGVERLCACQPMVLAGQGDMGAHDSDRDRTGGCAGSIVE